MGEYRENKVTQSGMERKGGQSESWWSGVGPALAQVLVARGEPSPAAKGY